MLFQAYYYRELIPISRSLCVRDSIAQYWVSTVDGPIKILNLNSAYEIYTLSFNFLNVCISWIDEVIFSWVFLQT